MNDAEMREGVGVGETRGMSDSPRQKPRRRRRPMSTARLAVVARRWGLVALIALTAIGALVQWLLR
jgi:hypothetical protein